MQWEMTAVMLVLRGVEVQNDTLFLLIYINTWMESKIWNLLNYHLLLLEISYWTELLCVKRGLDISLGMVELYEPWPDTLTLR